MNWNQAEREMDLLKTENERLRTLLKKKRKKRHFQKLKRTPPNFRSWAEQIERVVGPSDGYGPAHENNLDRIENVLKRFNEQRHSSK